MADNSKKRATPAGGDRVGRGTRWTEEQIQVLMDAVKGAPTAKDGFEAAAKKLGKNTGTVQQKYYNLQKKLTGGSTRRRAASRSTVAASSATSSTRRSAGAGSGLPGATELRAITIDELVGLAQRVKAEVDRRKQEIDAAEKLFK